MTPWPWAFLLPLPGLLLTAFGRGRRPGLASVPGPVALLLVAIAFLAGDHAPAIVRIDGFVPVLRDGAFALRFDALAAVMLAIVGGVSACVYVYSLAYLRGDPGQRRFFCLLDLFVLAMALLLLAGNLLVLLCGWAAVGLASFLLIAFWREREHTLSAGLQAIAANAIGDAALLLACVLVQDGDLVQLQRLDAAQLPGGPTLLAALLLVAAAAKSAQGPLYFWLPQAMAAPTPVSALIHAATMVAAGVYLLVRTAPLFELAPAVLAAMAWLGGLTALGSSIASLWQTNYKRGLAYSTCSQLGYMFAALGVGAPFAALFHLLTHASFKALLFLCAGVVIHAADGEEDLALLTGMRARLPRVRWLVLLGSLALCGLPLLTAGAFSKDLILDAGLERLPPLGWLLLGTTLLTGLYSGRLYFAVFGDAAAGAASRQRTPAPAPEQAHAHAHDAEEPLLLWPLLPLAAGAVLLGWVGWPLAALLQQHERPVLLSPLGIAAGGLALLGFFAARQWQRRAHGQARLRAFGVDWVSPTAALGRRLGRGLASLHDGRLGLYLFAAVLGIGAILMLAIGRTL